MKQVELKYAKLGNVSTFKFEGDFSNRRVEKQKSLEDILEKDGVFTVPIVVTPDMVIIDGQHRVAAAKSVGVPSLYYVIATRVGGWDTSHVIELQTSKKWDAMDHISAHAKSGSEDYIRLEQIFSENRSLTFTHDSEEKSWKLLGAVSEIYMDRAKINSPVRYIKDNTYKLDEEFGQMVTAEIINVLKVVGPDFYTRSKLVRAVRSVLTNWDEDKYGKFSPSKTFKKAMRNSMLPNKHRCGDYNNMVAQWKAAHLFAQS